MFWSFTSSFPKNFNFYPYHLKRYLILNTIPEILSEICTFEKKVYLPLNFVLRLFYIACWLQVISYQQQDLLSILFFFPFFHTSDKQMRVFGSFNINIKNLIRCGHLIDTSYGPSNYYFAPLFNNQFYLPNSNIIPGNQHLSPYPTLSDKLIIESHCQIFFESRQFKDIAYCLGNFTTQPLLRDHHGGTYHTDYIGPTSYNLNKNFYLVNYLII